MAVASCFRVHLFFLTRSLAASQDVAKLAWDWCQASFGFEFCLRYPPEVVAVCLLYGAARDLRVAVRGGVGREREMAARS